MTTDQETNLEVPADATNAPAPAAPVPEPKPEKTELELVKEKLARARAHTRDLEAARREERNAKDRIEELTAQLKEAKAEQNAATRKVLRLIDEGDSPPLFKKAKVEEPAEELEEDEDEEEIDEEDGEDEEPATDDTWKSTPISQLAFSLSQRNKLIECGVYNMGQLEDFRAGKWPEYPRGLNSVKGFGEAAVTAIENTILDWLKAFGPKVQEAVS